MARSGWRISPPRSPAACGARGIGDLDATLAAEIAVTVFKVALQRWIDQAGDLAVILAETIGALDSITTINAGAQAAGSG